MTFHAGNVSNLLGKRRDKDPTQLAKYQEVSFVTSHAQALTDAYKASNVSIGPISVVA